MRIVNSEISYKDFYKMLYQVDMKKPFSDDAIECLYDYYAKKDYYFTPEEICGEFREFNNEQLLDEYLDLMSGESDIPKGEIDADRLKELLLRFLYDVVYTMEGALIR